MKKLLAAALLVAVGLLLIYAAWSFWTQLTKPGILLIGVIVGASLTAAILIVLGNRGTSVPRYRANLPSPWERKRWS